MDVYTQGPVLQAFGIVGALFVAVKLFSFIRLLASVFVLPGTSLNKFGKKGSWAVVTGASDGIGKEYALQLARKGFNVVLVSRTQSKLEALCAEISKLSNVECKTLAMDFTENRDSDFEALRQKIDGLDVAILINNVGLSHDIPVPFIDTPKAELSNIITVNCIGTLKVTQIVALGMVKRRKGLILTMSSFGGLLPTPLLATYSGSKAFLQQWSSALGSELAGSNVTVECVQSYLVTSAMSKIRRASLFIPSERNFVKATLGSVGRSRGAQGMAYTSTPYWTHAIMHWSLFTFLGHMNRMVVEQNRKFHEQIRRRALRKQARQAKSL